MRSVARAVVIVCAMTLTVVSCGDDSEGNESNDIDEGSGVDESVPVYYVVGNVGDQATAEVVAPDGSKIGTVQFEQGATGVLLTVEVSGLTPGAHGIHLHTAGACTPDFTAAGGHINPDEGLHGLLNPERSTIAQDNGDLPNLYVASDGTVSAEFFTTLVTLSGGSMPALLDDDGSSVVIHENPDDHVTQPIGGAGGRVGCGVIQ